MKPADRERIELEWMRKGSRDFYMGVPREDVPKVCKPGSLWRRRIRLSWEYGWDEAEGGIVPIDCLKETAEPTIPVYKPWNKDNSRRRGPRPRQVCVRGLHLMTDSNTGIRSNGSRYCRECRKKTRQLAYLHKVDKSNIQGDK